MVGCLFHLVFYHRTQSLKINYFLASNTIINMLPNRNQACKVSDLGTNHLLIIGRLKVVDEPLDQFIFHHGWKHLHRKLAPPLEILTEKFPSSFLSSEELCGWELSQY